MPGGTLAARYSAADFTPDANLRKKIWKLANWAQFDHSMDGKANHPAEKTRVAAIWTAKYIYFAFWCKYEDLNISQRKTQQKSDGNYGIEMSQRSS